MLLWLGTYLARMGWRLSFFLEVGNATGRSWFGESLNGHSDDRSPVPRVNRGGGKGDGGELVGYRLCIWKRAGLLLVK